MYDVIVIGAGPAGCTAAKILAEKGQSVLLVEKFKLPRYKSCSGVLIEKSIHFIERFFGEGVPASATCGPAENKGMVFTTDKGKEYRFEQGGLNVWRGSFDHWLAEKAGESGAEVRDGTAAVSCEEKNGFVSVALCGESRYTEEASYVLNCEGVVGAVKRRLNGAAPDCITTFQTFNEGQIDLDPHYFYAYLQPELSEYDAWFNVKDSLLVLGVSVHNTQNINSYYSRFTAYMKERHHLRITRQLRSEKWLMPRIRPGCAIDYGKGRILFAGEAAGFLNPMGEGISAAMESGSFAAHAVLNHFEDAEAVYTEYAASTANLKTYMERQWSFVAQMAGTFGEMRL